MPRAKVTSRFLTTEEIAARPIGRLSESAPRVSADRQEVLRAHAGFLAHQRDDLQDAATAWINQFARLRPWQFQLNVWLDTIRSNSDIYRALNDWCRACQPTSHQPFEYFFVLAYRRTDYVRLSGMLYAPSMDIAVLRQHFPNGNIKAYDDAVFLPTLHRVYHNDRDVVYFMSPSLRP